MRSLSMRPQPLLLPAYDASLQRVPALTVAEKFFLRAGLTPVVAFRGCVDQGGGAQMNPLLKP